MFTYVVKEAEGDAAVDVCPKTALSPGEHDGLNNYVIKVIVLVQIEKFKQP